MYSFLYLSFYICVLFSLHFTLTKKQSESGFSLRNGLTSLIGHNILLLIDTWSILFVYIVPGIIHAPLCIF